MSRAFRGLLRMASVFVFGMLAVGGRAGAFGGRISFGLDASPAHQIDLRLALARLPRPLLRAPHHSEWHIVYPDDEQGWLAAWRQNHFETPKPGFTLQGITFYGPHRIFLRPAPGRGLELLPHEVFHVVWHETLTDEEKAAWQALWQHEKEAGALPTDYAGEGAEEGACEWFRFYQQQDPAETRTRYPAECAWLAAILARLSR